MAKMDLIPIDWAKPIEHVVKGTKIVYCGPQQHVDDGFKFLILSGENKDPMMVDEFGRIKTKGTSGVQKIRNVVEREGAPPLPPLVDFGPIAELSDALKDVAEHVPALKEVIVRATAALIRTSEENTKAATAIAAAMSDFRKLAADQQTAYMMVLEELTGKPEAVVAEPAPAAAKPKPVAIVRDLAEIAKATTGTADIKNFAHLETKASRETVQTLALATGVKRIVVGGYSSCRSGKDGQIKYNHEEINGLKATVYGQSYAHELFIACDRADKSAVIGVIEYLSNQTAAAR